MNKKIFEIERISSSDDTLRYTATVNGMHPVFKGHFPQAPVVPGVCTMNMLKECLSQAVSRPLRYEYIKECKFLSAITPTEHRVLEVNIDIKLDNDDVNVIAEVMSGETKMMKLKATLK